MKIYSGACIALLAMGCSGEYGAAELGGTENESAAVVAADGAETDEESEADEESESPADLEVLAVVELEDGGEVRFSQLGGGELLIVDGLVPSAGVNLAEQEALSPVELYTYLTGDSPPVALVAAYELTLQELSEDEAPDVSVAPTAVSADSADVRTVEQAIAYSEDLSYVGPFSGTAFCSPATGPYWPADYSHCWHDVWQTADYSYKAKSLHTYAYCKSGKIRHRARNNTISGWQTPASHDVLPGYLSYIYISGSKGWQKRGIVDEASASGDSYHASMMFEKD